MQSLSHDQDLLDQNLHFHKVPRDPGAYKLLPDLRQDFGIYYE